MMYAVVTYANMRGIRSVDRIVDLCERDLAFIWLTRGQKPKRDAFYDFKNRKLTSDILDDLNYQFMRRLQKEGLVTLKELFIDGTKIEANANRYTFVWRGSSITIWQDFWTLSTSFLKNIILFLQENDYGTKYELGNAQMFVIEGMDKVREATFMRMKEDHMLNGQLKPAYNVQIAVENYFIVHGYVSSDRTDYNTLIPVLEKHKNAFGSILEEVTADSGYCSEKKSALFKTE